MKNKADKKEPQIDMGLKYHGIPFIQKFLYRIRRFSIFLDQFNYWRLPLLWLLIFLTAASSAILTLYLFTNIENLPEQLPLLNSLSTPKDRLFYSSQITILLMINISIQIVTVIIGMKLFFKSKQITTMLLIISVLASIFLFIGIFKPMNMALQ